MVINNSYCLTKSIISCALILKDLQFRSAGFGSHPLLKRNQFYKRIFHLWREMGLSNQPQIPVFAPGHWAAHKHVWEGQWLHTDTQTQETRPPRSAVVLVLISVWNQDLFWDHGKKCVVVCLTDIKKRRKHDGLRKKCVLNDLLKWQTLIWDHILLLYGVNQPSHLKTV